MRKNEIDEIVKHRKILNQMIFLGIIVVNVLQKNWFLRLAM